MTDRAKLLEAKRTRRKRRLIHEMERFRARPQTQQAHASVNEAVAKQMFFPNAKLNWFERFKLYVSQTFKK